MCIGGGGGDPGAAAREAEAQRQREVQAAIARVNSMFADPSREQLYDQHREATTDLGMTELDRLREEKAREEKFRLARQGVLGGSAAADSESELGGAYQQGVMRIGDRARSSAEQLRQRDEAARQRAIQLASSSPSTGVAQQVANQSLRQTAQDASTGAQVGSLADLFNNIGNQYAIGQFRRAGGGTVNPGALAQRQFLGVGEPDSGFSGRVTKL